MVSKKKAECMGRPLKVKLGERWYKLYYQGDVPCIKIGGQLMRLLA
jgi:hypothetical protein